MIFYKVEVFIPKENAADFMDVLQEKRILKEGNYDRVFALTEVEGHFIPLKGSNPTIGEIDNESLVKEVKLEFRIPETKKLLTQRLIKKHHPYEKPVVNIIKLEE